MQDVEEATLAGEFPAKRFCAGEQPNITTELLRSSSNDLINEFEKMFAKPFEDNAT